MSDYEIMEEELEQQPFTIDTPEKAEWALALIREADVRLARMESIYNSEIRRITDNFEKAQRRYHQETDNLRVMLEGFFNTVPHETTKTQEKFKLLSGQLVRKRGTVKFDFDKDRLVSWLKENGRTGYIRTTEAPAWGEFKKVCDVVDGTVIDRETGAVVDCITAERQPDTFEVKIDA